MPPKRTDDAERRAHRERLRDAYQENLDRKELEAAKYGPLSVPTPLANEIEALQASIRALDAPATNGPTDEVLNALSQNDQYRFIFTALMNLQTEVSALTVDLRAQRAITNRLMWLMPMLVLLSIILLKAL